MKNNPTQIPSQLICFSHLRWDFVFQRPQHLLTRFSKTLNVYFFEEPVFDANNEAYLSHIKKADQLTVLVPHLIPGMCGSDVDLHLSLLLDKFFKGSFLNDWLFWYYTPMALKFTERWNPKMIIYDCMDELSAFDFAPQELVGLEKKLLAKADLVFTGGHSLYEAKKHQHQNIFSFPSSIDKEHFGKARQGLSEPADQSCIQGIKLGFFGVIDERFDIELIREIAEQRPEWQLILIGPVVKISPEVLPQVPNIHYLGQRSYEELPAYLSSWSIALIPFMLNDSTRFISPTKTPEYLSAGIPVVSTPIRDVVKPYGIKHLVHIGETSADFINAIEVELQNENRMEWLGEVDTFLIDNSWDNTQALMNKYIIDQLKGGDEISFAS